MAIISITITRKKGVKGKRPYTDIEIDVVTESGKMPGQVEALELLADAMKMVCEADTIKRTNG